MAHTLLADSIIYGFPSPSLPKQTGKAEYAATQDTHHILTKNVVSIESPHMHAQGRGQNGHIGLTLMATQYTLVIPVPFVQPTDPGRTPTIPEWPYPFDEKKSSNNTRNKIGNTTNVNIWTLPSVINSWRRSKIPTSTLSITCSRDNLQPRRSISLATSAVTMQGF